MTHGSGHWCYALLPLSSDDFIISPSCGFCCIIQRKESFFGEWSQQASPLDRIKAEDSSVGQLVVMMVTLFSPFRSSPKASLRSCFLKHTYEERVGRSLPETASAKEPPLTFDYPNKTYRNAFFYLFLVADLDCKVFLDPEKKT